MRLAVVVDLGLESGNCRHERDCICSIMIGISHVAELLLHLLFGYGFGIHGCLGILLCGHLVNNLFDEGGCVRLLVHGN